MRNVMIAVGVILIGTLLFLGSTVMILKFQGRLEGEQLKTLSKNPILGTFLPDPEPEAEAPPEAEGKGKGTPSPDSGRKTGSKKPQDEHAGKAGGSHADASSIPVYAEAGGAFTAEEIQEMVSHVQDSKAQCEKEWSAIEVEKLNLERLREDLTERKHELEKTMSQVAMAKSELDAARNRFRSELLSIEDNEDKMIRKLAEVYESMKPVEKAAEQFDEMDLDQAVKIMVRMDPGKAAKIFPYISAERVKDLTEKLSRFQEKPKSK
ncbi:MAG: hypothetical protein KJ645_00480 [Planctomycetes bacterium]|nr:hypothetical protein [Planctomycetota bacterium]